MKQPASEAVRLLRLIFGRFREDRCFQVAGGLTFTTLLALVPLVTIALTVISAFPVFSGLTSQLKVFLLTHLVPESAGKIISVYVTQFSENAGRLTAMGAVSLAVTAVLLLFSIERAFNGIWRVRRPRPWTRRVLIYWTALTLGPLLLGASLSLTSWLLGPSLGFGAQKIGLGMTSLRLGPWILTSLAFGLLYYLLPNRPLARRDAVIGGIVAGIGFELMKRGLTWYLAHFGSYKLVYGTFAAVPVFLLWLYLCWLVLLAGAVVVAVLPDWRDGVRPRPLLPGMAFVDALAVLVALAQAHDRGVPQHIAGLRRELGLGADAAEEILESLAAAGWVAPLQETGSWALTKDPAHIPLAELYRRSVFDPVRLKAVPGRDKLEPLLLALQAESSAALGMTVAECAELIPGAEPSRLVPPSVAHSRREPGISTH